MHLLPVKCDDSLPLELAHSKTPTVIRCCKADWQGALGSYVCNALMCGSTGVTEGNSGRGNGGRIHTMSLMLAGSRVGLGS